MIESQWAVKLMIEIHLAVAALDLQRGYPSADHSRRVGMVESWAVVAAAERIGCPFAAHSLKAETVGSPSVVVVAIEPAERNPFAVGRFRR